MILEDETLDDLQIKNCKIIQKKKADSNSELMLCFLQTL